MIFRVSLAVDISCVTFRLLDNWLALHASRMLFLNPRSAKRPRDNEPKQVMQVRLDATDRETGQVPRMLCKCTAVRSTRAS